MRAGKAAAAPETVREPESGVTFPVALTPPGSATPHWLMGTGIRQRTIFRVKVYGDGMLVAVAEVTGAAVVEVGAL